MLPSLRGRASKGQHDARIHAVGNGRHALNAEVEPFPKQEQDSILKLLSRVRRAIRFWCSGIFHELGVQHIPDGDRNTKSQMPATCNNLLLECVTRRGLMGVKHV